MQDRKAHWTRIWLLAAVSYCALGLLSTAIGDARAHNEMSSEGTQPKLVSREQLETTYFNSVKESIATWWNSSARPVQAPVIRFDLSANGKVSGVVVSESSGSKSTDAACKKALKKMTFDPFPERMTPKSGRPLELRVNMKTGELVPSLYDRYHLPGWIQWKKLVLDPESPLELPDRGGKDRF